MSNPKPPLFASADVLLDATGIARYLRLSGNDFRLYRQLLPGGLSGATIERITVRALQVADTPTIQPSQATLILKSLDPAKNWIMRATDDTRCREILFTQSPLWERLPQAIWSPVVASALAAGGKGGSSTSVSASRSRPLPASGALLMHDVQSAIFPATRCYAQPDYPLMTRLLERLTSMHATFWEDPLLKQLTWLATPAEAMLALTPENLNPLPTDASLYIQEARKGWEELGSLLPLEVSKPIRKTLDSPNALLQAVNEAPATLVHGDAWLANMGERNGRLVLLDWSFVTAGPPTFDSLWLAITWRALEPLRVLSDHRTLLLQQGVEAVADDATWELLSDLGWIRATLMGAESLARDVSDPTSVVPRAEATQRLLFWCERAAQILRARGW